MGYDFSDMHDVGVFVMQVEQVVLVRQHAAVEAYSYGLHVTLVEQCCFDRNLLAHKFNLFDLHHKYADVLDIDSVVSQLDALPRKVG